MVEAKRKAYLDAQTVLGPELRTMLAKQYDGNASDPMYQKAASNLIKQYVSNALSLTMDDIDAVDNSSL
jgi:hypothetical protein